MRPVKRATRMRHSACALAIATLACAASLGPSAVHAANGNGPQTTLDQSEPVVNPGYAAPIDGPYEYGQSFQAGFSGTLDHVALPLSAFSYDGTPVGDLTVGIYLTDSNGA